MSNRSPLAVAVLALISLAACGGGDNVDPNAVATTAPTPVPTATAATITARYQGNLLYNQPIELHANSGTDAAPVVNPTILQTVNTDPNTVPTGGQATFTGLNPTANYCWQYHYTPSGGTLVTATVCTDVWAAGLTLGS